MSKSKQIEQIRELLINDTRPKVVVFRTDSQFPNSMYWHNGVLLRRADCEKVPAKIKIFVNRKTPNHGKQI